MPDTYRLNQMIQDINGDPEAKERHRADPDSSYRKYGVGPDEQALLADGSIEAMTALGIHPNLQMKWIFINAKGPPPGPGPLASFIERLTTVSSEGRS